MYNEGKGIHDKISSVKKFIETKRIYEDAQYVEFQRNLRVCISEKICGIEFVKGIS